MKIAPKDVRYIKLGKGGRWEKISLERGELHFGHVKVPDEVALRGDREEIKQLRIAHGRDARAAGEDAREVIDFYQLGSDCLWITFAQDYLWWAFAEPEVSWLGPGDGHGERSRKTIGGWRNTDINGELLRMNSLSTKLTKVANYRRTLCRVAAESYLLRRLNGAVEPGVKKRNLTREALIDAVTEATALLHWADFETMVDIIFARSGWHRASPIGGTQKLVDMVVEHPVTGERAAVQVKSSATPDAMQKFVSRADDAGVFDHIFFVCHSPRGNLAPPADRNDIHVWCSREIAQTALRVGLVDWVLEKVP